jgi:hypothetical protein
LLLRGLADKALPRAAAACAAVTVIWMIVKIALPPDDYISGVLTRAAFNFINIASLADGLTFVLIGALAGYAIMMAVLRGVITPHREIISAALVALVLAAYWVWFDRWLHAENRYFLRTALFVATPALAMIASAYALADEGALRLRVPWLPRLMAYIPRLVAPRVAIGALALVTLVHAVETAKFVTVWRAYLGALHALAMSDASNPELGDPRFVSSARIPSDLTRVGWSSTTPYLSVLIAPDFAPARLVIDPSANYFWLSCETATASAQAARAIPSESRELVRRYNCLHR